MNWRFSRVVYGPNQSSLATQDLPICCPLGLVSINCSQQALIERKACKDEFRVAHHRAYTRSMQLPSKQAMQPNLTPLPGGTGLSLTSVVLCFVKHEAVHGKGAHARPPLHHPSHPWCLFCCPCDPVSHSSLPAVAGVENSQRS